MTTPICDFVTEYSKKNTIRLHMPGAKGIIPYFGDTAKLDITEIRGADYLYRADGIIKQSEQNASDIFGSLETVYSTEGSSICIKTMLAMTCNRGDTVIVIGDTHRSFNDGCYLLGIIPVKIKNARFLQAALTRHPEAKAVFITAVDYLGALENVRDIAAITHFHGKVLIADNAHGAYLNFLDDGLAHPNKCLADLCCDSAHKTLPVLTGGAYLHINNPVYCSRAKQKMILFGSTSPSYLILQSLDYANSVISRPEFTYSLTKIADKVLEIKSAFGITTAEPLKCVFLSETDPAPIFEELRIEPELLLKSDEGFIVILMFSAGNTSEEMETVKSALAMLKIKPEFEITDSLIRKCGKSE
ncbi:MAG: amino acid decarboxylase [Ruminococcus sp.]|jgi:arginine/lysine/ornithine decarboxylase|nr:amino acid decarboxylase [Ruminococcus sp.]